MPFIHLTTFIEAPQERVFDLSRSVALHKASMKHHEEKIIDGPMSGLMNLHARDENLRYSNVIDKINSKMITFSLTVE